jgi:hypothetical protein
VVTPIRRIRSFEDFQGADTTLRNAPPEWRSVDPHARETAVLAKRRPATQCWTVSNTWRAQYVDVDGRAITKLHGYVLFLEDIARQCQRTGLQHGTLLQLLRSWSEAGVEPVASAFVLLVMELDGDASWTHDGEWLVGCNSFQMFVRIDGVVLVTGFFSWYYYKRGNLHCSILTSRPQTQEKKKSSGG